MGLLLCFFTVTGRYWYDLEGHIPVEETDGAYVLVRWFDEVDTGSTDWKFAGAEHLDGFKMYQFKTGTPKSKYGILSVNHIRQPVQFMLHPEDTNKSNGMDGGATHRRFFHVADSDPCGGM